MKKIKLKDLKLDGLTRNDQKQILGGYDEPGDCYLAACMWDSDCCDDAPYCYSFTGDLNGRMCLTLTGW